MFRIKGENILSYKYIEFDFRKRGLASLTGVNEDNPMFSGNGCGKTTILQALRWGLYGDSSKGDNADAIVNTRIGKDCWLEVEFGKFLIKRYRKHSKFKNDLQFYIDGTDQTGKSNKETQAKIEKEIGLNQTSFLYSIYFDGANINSFAAAGDAKQKEIIENILGLNTLTYAQKWCKDQIDLISGGLPIKASEIAMKESQLRQVDVRIADLDSKSTKFEVLREAEKKNILDNIGILELKKVTEPLVDISKAQSLIGLAESKQQEYDSFSQKKSIIDADIKDLNAKKMDLLNEKNRLKLEQTNQNNKLKLEHQNKVNAFNLADAKLKNKISNITADMDKLEKECNHYKTAKVKVCLSCNQPITDKTVQEKIEKIEEKWTQLFSDRNKLYSESSENMLHNGLVEDLSLDTTPIEIEDTISPQIRTKEEEKVAIDEQAKKIKVVLDTANQLRLKIEQEKTRLAEVESIDSLITVWDGKFIEATNKTNPYGEQIEVEVSSKSSIFGEIKKLNDEKNVIENEIVHYEYWVEGFSNRKLKSYIMESITPFINSRANYYSRFLTGGSFVIDISTQTISKNGDVKEKFAVKVESVDSDYSSASGGELRRIDICILLALQDLVASRAKCDLNILILDECTENLDAVGVEKMIELLAELAETKESVLFITHDDKLRDYFPNKIVVTKKGGFSTITQ